MTTESLYLHLWWIQDGRRERRRALENAQRDRHQSLCSRYDEVLAVWPNRYWEKVPKASASESSPCVCWYPEELAEPLPTRGLRRQQWVILFTFSLNQTRHHAAPLQGDRVGQTPGDFPEVQGPLGLTPP